MTTPAERRAMVLLQEVCTRLDELYLLSGLETGAAVFLCYASEVNETTIISMRYAEGNVGPADIGVSEEHCTNLREKPSLTVVPKE